jgi:uncharacterized protein YigA (DUF484 family)
MKPNNGNNKVYIRVHEKFTWDEAVKDAERELRKARDRVRELRAALSTLKEKAAQNAPVPGE